MRILPIDEMDREAVSAFFIKQWGAPEMVVSSGVYDCSQLAGFFACIEQEIAGLVTYVTENEAWEMISLDSVLEGQGIGSTLVDHVEQQAKENGVRFIYVVTTNDNMHALTFYQKRGYVLHELYPDAVKKARAIKPSIPLIGYKGIPIRDEIKLIKWL